MPEHLMFTLWAPLGSMGEIAVGERRTGFDRPARSAVLGLLAAALGVERREEEAHAALAEGYGLALRVEAAGSILLDYHTAQVPPARRGRRWATRRAELAEPGLGTILSKREYREGPRCTVALWERKEAPYTLERLAQALRRPRFTLYFGRKGCPLGLPPAPRLVEAETLALAFAAFDREMPDAERGLRERLRLTGGRPRYYADIEAASRLGLKEQRVERRRDQPLSRQRWQFGLREEVVAEEPRP